MEDNKDKEQIKPRAFETLEERMAKRRKKASIGKLITYIITLILALIILFWLRSVGRF
jgi:hypothetical protein